jgi:hypothetical protein
VSSPVFRVTWVPGTDELLGVCHCGAEHLANDPIELWAWLLAHPDGHDAIGGPRPEPAAAGVTR